MRKRHFPGSPGQFLTRMGGKASRTGWISDSKWSCGAQHLQEDRRLKTKLGEFGFEPSTFLQTPAKAGYDHFVKLLYLSCVSGRACVIREKLPESPGKVSFWNSEKIEISVMPAGRPLFSVNRIYEVFPEAHEHISSSA